MGGTATLAAAILIAVAWWSQKPQMALLYGGLDPSEAAKIGDELRDQKVVHEISSGGRAIKVPSHLVYNLRMQLASKGVPKMAGGGSGVGFEIFDKNTLGLTDFLQKANYNRAIQGELERTIRQMEEVENARVMIVSPEDRLFVAEKPDTKASVFLQLRSRDRLARQKVDAIRFLVANSVVGLKPSHVAVVDSSGNVLAEDTAEDSTAGLSASQLQMRKDVETLYTTKVQSMLDQVLGPGQSVVRASIDLSFDNVSETKESMDPNTVVKSELITTEESKNPVRMAGGVPGPESNAVTNNPTADSGIMMGTSKKSTTNNQYDMGKTVQTILKGGGEIKRMSMAVFINLRLDKGTGGGERKPMTRPQGEITRLEKVIKSAIGFVNEGKGKRVDEFSIEEVSFEPLISPENIPVAKTVTVAVTVDRVSTWLGWTGQILLALLAVGLLIYFVYLLRSSQNERLKADLSIYVDDLLAPKEKAAVITLGQKLKGAITVEDLSKLIRENPSNMAQALKNWVGE